jgi:prepilin-type N-terminal cleavage/methylation domain-containing protein
VKTQTELLIRGFTRLELMVVALIFSLLAAVALVSCSASRERSKRIQCSSNLTMIGLSFKTWALDNSDRFPMETHAEQGSAEAFRYFQMMSNALANPRILICPADGRKPAKDMAGDFSNSNLSYFVGLDARDTNPHMFLLGDRNLTNGPLPPNRILVLNTNFPVGWTREMHHYQGNIVLSDGSVQQFSSAALSTALGNNRLAMP